MTNENKTSEIKSNRNAEMSKVTNKNLQANPFTTYRDPKTGRWIVLKPNNN